MTEYSDTTRTRNESSYNGVSRLDDYSTNMVANRDSIKSISNRVDIQKKAATLSKFKEDRDDQIYSNEFDFDDQDLYLSYSKFSQVSESSGIVRSNGPISSNESITESPFVKRIQGKVPVIFEQDSRNSSTSRIKFTSEDRPLQNVIYPIEEMSNDKSNDSSGEKEEMNNEYRNTISIEGENDENDENDSPFLEKVIRKTPYKQKQHNTNNSNLQHHTNYTNRSINNQFHNNKSQHHDIGHINHQDKNQWQLSKLRKNVISLSETPALPPTPVLSADRTPRKGMRNPSVNVSLTPAQRIEKKPGIRSSNALDSFQFSKLVGRGAFANVYKGINLKTNQVIAIKQIMLEGKQNVAGLMGEIDLLKILKHPNIVKYHGFVKTSSSLNILLEFCSGGSLRQLYKKMDHGLPEPQLAKYTTSILHGLNYLHEQGVVHRDVKAANVLLTESGEIKLADFGLATKVTSQHHSAEGTPNWMAPETVLGGDGICTASDIWSLGATIIELFTMNPPYHDLNPMAALHAIGTDDHPPLPKFISSLAKDFLMECFQKQASLRSTAKLLLKHRWLLPSGNISKTSMLNLNGERTVPKMELKSIASYSEMNEESWDKDFEGVKIPNIRPGMPDIIQITDVDGELDSLPSSVPPPKYTKEELLQKFSEKNDSSQGDGSSFSGLHSAKLRFNIEEQEKLEDESDPFLNIDIENFDTNELEIQSKMEYLVSKFSNRVELAHTENEDIIGSLVKITGRMLHLVKKYPVSHDVLIRDHGVLSFLELLDSASELPKNQKLWLYTLSVLNHIFENNVGSFENFCLLGGIPAVTQFKSSMYDINIRLQVVRFVGIFQNSEKALSMLVSSGGLRVVSKFLEEDFDSTPSFPLAAVDCIASVLTKDFTRSKSDLCRILAKYGVLFWFVVLLNRLIRIKSKPAMTEVSEQTIEQTMDNIISIIKFFGQSEARVRQNISSPELYKLLFKVYPHLGFNHQLSILKFVKSMSCISNNLKSLYKAEISEFLISQLEAHIPSTVHYKEVNNIIAPILYNCCYLNHSREVELVQLGVVPYLKTLSMINLPFKQFVLPLLCEMVHCEHEVRDSLKKHDILTVYYNLLLDPYWQSNSLDSIIKWAEEDSHYVKIDSSRSQDCLVAGFLLPKVSNLEGALENYFKLIVTYERVGRFMANANVINNIVLKLRTHNKNAVVQLNLLRILKQLIVISTRSEILEQMNVAKTVTNALELLKSHDGSVLIVELATETLAMMNADIQ
ncbi:hypothetical protein G9P44_002095 [Scheffersomyces stipitis]|nr:hypothetical protein G9P44_002095 [Scheffersomyces stipitis]